MNDVVINTLFIVLIASSGPIIFLIGWRNFRNGLASRNWPTTEGVVTDSRVTIFRLSWNQLRSSYTAVVVYEYQVDGRNYISKRISFGQRTSFDKGWVEQIVENYPAGESVTVFYDPSRPNRAVLEPRFEWASLVYLALGLCGFVASVYVVISLVTNRL